MIRRAHMSLFDLYSSLVVVVVVVVVEEEEVVVVVVVVVVGQNYSRLNCDRANEFILIVYLDYAVDEVDGRRRRRDKETNRQPRPMTTID